MNEAVLRVLAKLGLDAKPFEQEKVIELVKNTLSGAWTTVYSHHDAADGRSSVFGCFADLTRKQEILAGDDWLKIRWQRCNFFGKLVHFVSPYSYRHQVHDI